MKKTKAEKKLDILNKRADNILHEYFMGFHINKKAEEELGPLIKSLIKQAYEIGCQEEYERFLYSVVGDEYGELE